VNERQHARFRLRLAASRIGWHELVLFGLKQGSACLFGVLLLALLAGTFLFYPQDVALARYDFLVLACVGVQAALLLFKLETWREAKVIFLFHIVGTVMEIFKTQMGSWTYPEDSLLRIAGVPLFSGFMYAAVGSYLARAWRLFDFRFTHYPPLWATYALAIAIYVNFFAHHFLWDMRLALFAATGLLFWRSTLIFTAHQTARQIPVLLGFLLVALAIWLAENIATYARAWAYPHQELVWRPVKAAKIGAWYLLMIISFVLVTTAHRLRAPNQAGSFSARAASR
jgi:uncharacterized membrane protein YoaT (DUF817 family)